jgi:hypothetical protein
MTTRGRARDQYTDQAADAAIVQACRILRLPSIPVFLWADAYTDLR